MRPIHLVRSIKEGVLVDKTKEKDARGGSDHEGFCMRVWAGNEARTQFRDLVLNIMDARKFAPKRPEPDHRCWGTLPWARSRKIVEVKARTPSSRSRPLLQEGGPVRVIAQYK